MHQSKVHWILALVVLMAAVDAHALRLMETDGIELRGVARVVAYGAATCHIRDINHSEEEYERLKVNEGKPLNLWQMDFSVYNGSGKGLDHLIALYGVEAPWPPCTHWSDNPGVSTTGASWSEESGLIQRRGKPFSVAPGETMTEEVLLIVFHEDTPRFANWSVDYNFAESTHATPDTQPPQATAQPPAEQRPAPAQAVAPQPAQAPGLPSGISAGEMCAGKPIWSACWKELANQPGCYVWVYSLEPARTVTWSAECAGGLAQGQGTLTGHKTGTYTGTGHLQDGKMHGQWVIRIANGYVNEISFVDGKRHGRWVERFANGDVHEGHFVDDKMHGQWAYRFANGDVHEGPFVDDKRHGQWVIRFANGDVHEGPFVDDKRHGQWVERFANGTQSGHWLIPFSGSSVREVPHEDGKKYHRWDNFSADDYYTWEGFYEDGTQHGWWDIFWDNLSAYDYTWEGSYEDGTQHGQWAIYGSTWEGSYEDGTQHSQWDIFSAGGYVDEDPFVDDKPYDHGVIRDADGDVREGPYVDGKKHGQWAIRFADGSVWEGPYVDGKKHGQWAIRDADGNVIVKTWEKGYLMGSEYHWTEPAR